MDKLLLMTMFESHDTLVVDLRAAYSYVTLYADVYKATRVKQVHASGTVSGHSSNVISRASMAELV